jgi:ribokinase
LNPAPAQELDAELLGNVSILTPNEKEAYMLTGIEPKESAAAERAAQRLRQRGVGSVVITLGEKGAYLLTEDESELISPAKVTPKDTTAAGDAFNGALATALARGRGLREAVFFANRTAAISVTRIGAQPSLPGLQEVEAFSN